VLPPPVADVIMRALDEVFAHPQPVPVPVEYELPLPSGPRSFEAMLVRTDDEHLLCLARDVTEQKRTQDRHRELAARLIASQESERQRIGRELHDNLSQEIALLSIDLDRFSRMVPVNAEQARHLSQISERVAEMSSDVHQLSHELHPSKLQTLGLVAAIRSLCLDISYQHGIEVEFSPHGAAEKCGPDAALCVYRIAQEALHNVVRHSGASRAAVTLSRDKNELYLQVADSGVGFDLRRFEHHGLGLVSMRERAWLAGGRLAIHTAPHAGTRIGARVPLGDSDRSLS